MHGLEAAKKEFTINLTGVRYLVYLFRVWGERWTQWHISV